MFSKALDIRPGVTAVIGGGGKTSLLRYLGEELSQTSSVLLCTTTKIYPFQGIPAVHSLEELERVSEPLVCMGTALENGKLTAPSVPMEVLAKRFDYVLVEADGSAQRPMKAHAPHEPVIPPESADVILVVGASGFGRPIAQAAHRPERYAALADRKEEDIVTAKVAAQVVTAEGLHRKIFVNQAEENLAYAREFAALMQGCIVLGSIQKGEIYSCSF